MKAGDGLRRQKEAVKQDGQRQNKAGNDARKTIAGNIKKAALQDANYNDSP